MELQNVKNISRDFSKLSDDLDKITQGMYLVDRFYRNDSFEIYEAYKKDDTVWVYPLKISFDNEKEVIGVYAEGESQEDKCFRYRKYEIPFERADINSNWLNWYIEKKKTESENKILHNMVNNRSVSKGNLDNNEVEYWR